MTGESTEKVCSGTTCNDKLLDASRATPVMFFSGFRRVDSAQITIVASSDEVANLSPCSDARIAVTFLLC